MDASRKKNLDRRRLERDVEATRRLAEMPFGKFLLRFGLVQAVVLFCILWFVAEGQPDFGRLALGSALGGLLFALGMRVFYKWYLGRLQQRLTQLEAER